MNADFFRLMAVFLGASLAWLIWRAWLVRRTWAAFAAEVGGVYSGFAFGGTAAVRTPHRGATILLQRREVPTYGKKQQRYWTDMTVHFATTRELTFRVMPQTWGSWLFGGQGEALAAQLGNSAALAVIQKPGDEIQIGVPALDEKYLVRSTDESAVRSILQSGEIVRALADAGHVQFELTPDEEATKQGLMMLRVRCNGEITNGQRLRGMYDVVVNAFDELMRLEIVECGASGQ